MGKLSLLMALYVAVAFVAMANGFEANQVDDLKTQLSEREAKLAKLSESRAKLSAHLQRLYPSACTASKPAGNAAEAFRACPFRGEDFGAVRQAAVTGTMIPVGGGLALGEAKQQVCEAEGQARTQGDGCDSSCCTCAKKDEIQKVQPVVENPKDRCTSCKHPKFLQVRWPANKVYEGNKTWTFERSINVDYGECNDKLVEPRGGYDLGTDRGSQMKCGVSHCMQAQGGGGWPNRNAKKILCQRVCVIGGDLTVQPHWGTTRSEHKHPSLTSYKWGSGSSCSGSAGANITSATDCEKVAKTKGLAWKGTETASTFPTGCYKYQSSGTAPEVYFNHHATGKSHHQSTPLCKADLFPEGDPQHYDYLFLRDDGSVPPWEALGGYCPNQGCRWEARCLLNKINVCVKNADYSESKCNGCSGTECKKFCPQFTCSSRKTIKCLAIILAGKSTYNDHPYYRKNTTTGDTPIAPFTQAQQDECAFHRNACMNVGMVL